MTSEIKRRLHTVYGIILSILILITGACLAFACLSIYRSGDAPFTYASIHAHFSRIAFPVYLCIVGVLGGIVITVIWPIDQKGLNSRREEISILVGLIARLDEDACDADTLIAIRREHRIRHAVTVTAAAVGVAVFVYPLLLCLEAGAFSVTDLNRDVMAASFAILPAAVLALTAGIAASLLKAASVSRETKLVKGALALGHKKPASQSDVALKGLNRPRVLWAVRCSLLALALLLVILGIFNGGMADVLGKAVRICTECIGLG